MMDIKFRAWIKDAQVMVGVTCIDFNPDGYPPFIVHEDISMPPPTTALEPNEPVCTTDIDKCALEQYTGLKDKNGKEIFEGDILTRDGVNSNWENEEVGYYKYMFVRYSRRENTEYNLGGCDFDPDGEKNSNGQSIQLIVEIIGNIHENPELLEAKDD